MTNKKTFVKPLITISNLEAKDIVTTSIPLFGNWFSFENNNNHGGNEDYAG